MSVYVVLKTANLIRKIVKRMKKAYLELLEDTLTFTYRDLKKLIKGFNQMSDDEVKHKLQFIANRIERISDLKLGKQYKFKGANRH